MGNILSRPSRSLTNSGARIFKSYHTNSPVEFAPGYLDLNNWQEYVEKGRSSDAHMFTVKIHPNCKLKPSRRSVFLPFPTVNAVMDKIFRLDEIVPSVLAVPASGKSELSKRAADTGLRVVDSNAMLSALMNRPFGFPNMSRKQTETLAEDQSILFSSLALSAKVPVGNVLFLSNLTSGMVSRSWINFTRSYAVPQVLTFLVVMPPDVLYSRRRTQFEQEVERDPSYATTHKPPTHQQMVSWMSDVRKTADEGCDHDFVIEVDDRGDDTLYLSDVFSIVRHSKGADQ